jgi:hypothetical protein
MMNGHYHPYVQAAIEGEVARMASAKDGERNNTLYRSTVALASLGLLEGEILRHLQPVAKSGGLHGGELYSTVKSGMKTGRANPRTIPSNEEWRTPVQSPLPREVPRRLSVGECDFRKFLRAGDQGPNRFADEARRHVYKRDGRPIRIKIKRQSGRYVNWYRVTRGTEEGWEPAKPDDYIPFPYTGDFDPFDTEFRDEALYWPEGEKDADTLSTRGLPAFTFGGASDGLPSGIDSWLKNRDLVVLTDNDNAGRLHAAKKAERAYAAGAASIRIIDFTELPPKGDVSDYLKTASVDELIQRVETTAPWSPQPTQLSIGQQPAWKDAVISASELKTKMFHPARYALPGYIAEGVTIVAGKPKIGKSWLLYDICVACAGDRFTLGDIKPSQGDVLYLAMEDSQRRLKARLEKLCPNEPWPERLTLATSWKRADEGGLRDIDDWCSAVQKPVLIVVDTLEKLRPAAKPHTPQYSADYAAITGLHRIAHERGVAIVVVHHVRKMEADDPFDMVSGTNGLTGAADTILVLRKQAGTVTLHARGRDIEEKQTACEFNKDTCRWTLLGEAEKVHNSGERTAILEALAVFDTGQMRIAEIMAATGRRDRNALDQLLFKMLRDGDLVRVKRGVYGLPGKNGKKERSEDEPAE